MAFRDVRFEYFSCVVPTRCVLAGIHESEPGIGGVLGEVLGLLLGGCECACGEQGQRQDVQKQLHR